MKNHNCKNFDCCSAPICPMDDGIGSAIWFPDEEICSLHQYCRDTPIRNQKKIAKKRSCPDTYYTYEMLDHAFVIGKAIEGLDPEDDLSTADRRVSLWLSSHPMKSVLSESKKEILRLRIKDARHMRVDHQMRLPI